jgi:small subunit ribosomal protein S9
MAIKKAVKKNKPKKKEVKKEEAPLEVVKKPVEAEKRNPEKYFYAVGKRKTSIAKVKLFPSKEKETSVEINKRDLDKYFSLDRLKDSVKAPLGVVSDKKFFISATVQGGGIMGQAEAIRLGISRSLVKMDADLKKSLKVLGFITRDARIVERKKPGKKKARRSPQWAKR